MGVLCFGIFHFLVVVNVNKEKKKLMFEQVKKIVFITSESCNLNCKYCEISKNSTKNHFEEAKKVKQALLDGSYVTRYM